MHAWFECLYDMQIWFSTIVFAHVSMLQGAWKSHAFAKLICNTNDSFALVLATPVKLATFELASAARRWKTNYKVHRLRPAGVMTLHACMHECMNVMNVMKSVSQLTQPSQFSLDPHMPAKMFIKSHVSTHACMMCLHVFQPCGQLL